jgi:hypothetical protein
VRNDCLAFKATGLNLNVTYPAARYKFPDTIRYDQSAFFSFLSYGFIALMRLSVIDVYFGRNSTTADSLVVLDTVLHSNKCYSQQLSTVRINKTLYAQLVEALRYKPEGRGFDPG